MANWNGRSKEYPYRYGRYERAQDHAVHLYLQEQECTNASILLGEQGKLHKLSVQSAWVTEDRK